MQNHILLFCVVYIKHLFCFIFTYYSRLPCMTISEGNLIDSGKIHLLTKHYIIRKYSRFNLQASSSCGADCSCGVWCRGSTTSFLYVGQLFGNIVWNDSGFVSLTQWRATFSLFLIMFFFTYILMPHNMKILYFHLVYFHVSNSTLSFTQHSGALLLPRRSLDTVYLYIQT